MIKILKCILILIGVGACIMLLPLIFGACIALLPLIVLILCIIGIGFLLYKLDEPMFKKWFGKK